MENGERNEMKVIVLHGYDGSGKTTVLNSLVYPKLKEIGYKADESTLELLGYNSTLEANKKDGRKTLKGVDENNNEVYLDFRVILTSPSGVKIGFVTQGDHWKFGSNEARYFDIPMRAHLAYFKDKGCTLVICAVPKKDDQKIFEQVKEFDPSPIEISMEEYIQGIYGDVTEKVIRTFDREMKELESKK